MGAIELVEKSQLAERPAMQVLHLDSLSLL